jgi:hypothetical protein
MAQDKLIAVTDVCRFHNIEISFISSLHQSGLIEITTLKEKKFIDIEQLQELEKMIRFHYELNINLEGIQAITHLLQRIKISQFEIMDLKNKLRLFEFPSNFPIEII